MTTTNIGLVGGIIILVLLSGLVWFGRNRRYRYVRLGFFLERERFKSDTEKEEDDRPADRAD